MNNVNFNWSQNYYSYAECITFILHILPELSSYWLNKTNVLCRYASTSATGWHFITHLETASFFWQRSWKNMVKLIIIFYECFLCNVNNVTIDSFHDNFRLPVVKYKHKIIVAYKWHTCEVESGGKTPTMPGARRTTFSALWLYGMFLI